MSTFQDSESRIQSRSPATAGSTRCFGRWRVSAVEPEPIALYARGQEFTNLEQVHACSPYDRIDMAHNTPSQCD